MDTMKAIAEALASKHTYTEAEVRLVMLGMNAEIDALRRTESDCRLCGNWAGNHYGFCTSTLKCDGGALFSRTPPIQAWKTTGDA